MKIKHDFHIHTVYSLDADESATVENYIREAKEVGFKKLGFAEHFWDNKIDGAFKFYQRFKFDNFLSVKNEIESLSNKELQLYFGCEVEYNPARRAPAITEETAEKFDYVIVPHSHSHETMPKEYYDNPQRHLNFVLDAYNNIIDSNISRYITAMAHPFALVRCPYPSKVLIDMVSDDTLKKMFDKTAQKDIAVEINTGCFFMDGITSENIHKSPLIRIFKVAKECGCKFIFGSDAHHPDHIKRGMNADAVGDYIGLRNEDIAPIAK